MGKPGIKGLTQQYQMNFCSQRKMLTLALVWTILERVCLICRKFGQLSQQVGEIKAWKFAKRRNMT